MGIENVHGIVAASDKKYYTSGHPAGLGIAGFIPSECYCIPVLLCCKVGGLKLGCIGEKLRTSGSIAVERWFAVSTQTAVPDISRFGIAIVVIIGEKLFRLQLCRLYRYSDGKHHEPFGYVTGL